MKKKIWTTIAIHIIAWGIASIWIIPFFGLFMTAVRPYDEIIYGWWHFEKFTFTLKNFLRAWTHPTASLKDGMRNSLMVAIPATVIPIFIASISGYAFARFRFPLKNYLFITIVALMTLPQQMIAIPIFRLMKSMKLLNTYMGLVLVHSAWAMPWMTFFMRNYFTILPIEVEEAAMVDGASDTVIFFRIVFPMSTPAIISISALQFSWVWSDFFVALILIFSPNKLLATQRIPLMRGVYFVDWGLLSAAAILVMSVPVLVFVLLQRYYIKGMVGWTLK